MSEFQSRLVPFDSDKMLAIEITCKGKIIEHHTLDIRFVISGDIDNILFDPPIANSQRTDNLWQKSCFEVFIQNNNSTNYWEYNLSPSTNWAIYGFTNYRQGKFDELSIDSLQISTNREGNQYVLSGLIPLPQALIEQNLRIGLSCVVQDKLSDISYYALKHTKNQADFHAADSFSIAITA